MRPIALFPLLAASLFSQNLADFEKKVTEFTLANGLHFIVMERHEAPVVSFHLHVDSGAANDPANASSTAHMFEHMIGKGTTSLGTKNWPEEEKALAAVEQAYDKLEEERVKGRRSDKAQIERLEAALKKAIDKANSFVDPNAFTKEIERNGGVGFNASTALDYTNYFYSLPANRTELWFALQSEWTAKPVFREFYKERDVVREERRMRVESSTQGKLIEALLTTSFTAHPYRNFIGWASDIENLRAKGGAEFHKTYYVPGNMCVGIVGDVNPAEIKRALDFGPAGIMVPSIDTADQAQQVIRAVRIPPLGDRGAASSTRASRYGFGYQQYLETANQTLVTMLQIESRTAVENVDRIAAIDGADVLFVGPTDLSISMNVEDASPAFQQALETIAAAARANGKAAGILARTQQQAAKYKQLGYSVIAIESDRGLLAKGFRNAVTEFAP